MSPRVAHVVIDSVDPARLATFWGELLGMKVTQREDDWLDLEPLAVGGPVLSLQQVPERKTVKNRVHFDVGVPDVVAAGEWAYSLGATPAGLLHPGPPPWRVWRDPEGNEFCLVTAG